MEAIIVKKVAEKPKFKMEGMVGRAYRISSVDKSFDRINFELSATKAKKAQTETRKGILTENRGVKFVIVT